MKLPGHRLVALLLFAVGCATTAPVRPDDSLAEVPIRQLARRPAVFTRHGEKQAGLTADEQRHATSNCPFGMPRVTPAAGAGPTLFAFRDGYVLEHSSTLKIPLWVCEGVVAAQLQGDLQRSDRFAPDPTLPKGQRSELADYRGSGFDRGHQAPAGDQTVDATLKAETFYLSNMAPQQPQLNQQIWAALEALVRDWLVARGSGFVVTGPLFYDENEEDAKTADGLVEYETIGPGAVAVPTHFYKLVVAKSASGAWEAIAFVIPNHGFQRPYNFAQFTRAIAWIQDRTGIDFMPDLKPDEEQRLEAKPSPLWQ